MCSPWISGPSRERGVGGQCLEPQPLAVPAPKTYPAVHGHTVVGEEVSGEHPIEISEVCSEGRALDTVSSVLPQWRVE